MSTDSWNHPRLPGDRPLIASLRHTVILLLIQLGLAAGGAYVQQRPSNPASNLTHEHRAVASVYVVMIMLEWALVYYVWLGIRRQKRVGIGTLVEGRSVGWERVMLDFAIAVPFWFVWEKAAALMHHVLGQSHAKSIDALLPQGVVEITLWCALSVSAGFCEEVVYRGYLQRQFEALTGSIAFAILAQGFVFGIAHGYQGAKQVVVITGLGVLYGALAAWRKNLRPGILAHAWSDIYGGWLSKLLTK